MKHRFEKLLAGGLMAGCAAWAAAQTAPAPHAHQHAAMHDSKPAAALTASAPATPVVCGTHFVMAMNMVNAAMRAGQNLPADAKISRTEIDSLFGMAVTLAHREAPCVRTQLKGPSGFGYDASYSKMLLAASSYAQSRQLAPSVVAQAREAGTLLAR